MSTTLPTRLRYMTHPLVVYGRDPPTIRSYEAGETRVTAVARSMVDREGQRGKTRRQRGKTLPATTDQGYELRSRGPATLGPDALDT